MHGKKPRDYSYTLQKKGKRQKEDHDRSVRSLGLRVALSAKMRENRLAIVEDLNLEQHKTKVLRNMLAQRGWTNALFIDGKPPRVVFDCAGDMVSLNFRRASRGLSTIDLLPQRGANVYSILRRDLVILSLDAVKQLQKRLATK